MYTFDIKLDKQSDLWNWTDSVDKRSAPDFTRTWQNKLKLDDDLMVYKKAATMPQTDVKKFVAHYLKQKYQREKFGLQSYEEFVNKVYSIKFADACKKLEEITQHPLYFKKYTIQLTTFPRCLYNELEGYFFIYISDIDVIETFMHEALHFQFYHYWRNDPHSPVSKLSETNFHYLNEALTVVLDNDLVPLIEFYDRGYESQQDFRKLLHTHWKKYHDFDKLVDYGMKNLPKFVNN